MAVSLKELTHKESYLSRGHSACAGCAGPVVIRQIMLAAADHPLVVTFATGCMEVVSTLYPYTAWKCSYIHNAFENSAATLSGIETAFRKLREQDKVSGDYRFIAFGGDGGTYDIGFQSLSGTMERGHRLLYVCYDNQAYMNTVIQRSSATPKGAWTNTSPVGTVGKGKEQHRKDLTSIIVDHEVPYVAQVSPHNYRDLMNKVQKALEVDGPSFINAIAPCPLGWGYPNDQTMVVTKLAVETCFWPIFEVENGVWKVNYKPKNKLPITEWLKGQRRFKHLFTPENEWIIEDLQKHVDKKWEELLRKEECFGGS